MQQYSAREQSARERFTPAMALGWPRHNAGLLACTALADMPVSCGSAQ